MYRYWFVWPKSYGPCGESGCVISEIYCDFSHYGRADFDGKVCFHLHNILHLWTLFVHLNQHVMFNMLYYPCKKLLFSTFYNRYVAKTSSRWSQAGKTGTSSKLLKCHHLFQVNKRWKVGLELSPTEETPSGGGEAPNQVQHFYRNCHLL